MDKQLTERGATSVGRSATIAAIAGLAGLAVALAVTGSVVFGAVFHTSPGLAPGYEDYGQRHRADYAARDDGSATISVTNDQAPDAAQDNGSPGRLDDYGLRCLEVGWCSVPPGMPQPHAAHEDGFATISVTNDRAPDAAQDNDSSGRLDDYGLRCLVVGWCSGPPGVPQPTMAPAED
jgi:hypothetical protein